MSWLANVYSLQPWRGGRSPMPWVDKGGWATFDGGLFGKILSKWQAGLQRCRSDESATHCSWCIADYEQILISPSHHSWVVPLLRLWFEGDMQLLPLLWSRTFTNSHEQNGIESWECSKFLHRWYSSCQFMWQIRIHVYLYFFLSRNLARLAMHEVLVKEDYCQGLYVPSG